MPIATGAAPRPNLFERGQLAMLALTNGLKLLARPERTEYVFSTALYINILIPGRHLEAFCAPTAALPSPDELWALPRGSLGQTYAEYMGPLLEANASLHQVADDVRDRERNTAKEALRLRFHDIRQEHRRRAITDQHDLWHVVTGYSTSEVDEVCLQAFNHAQVGNGLSLAITFGGLLRALLRAEWSAPARIWNAYQRGRQSQVLLFVDWQLLWSLPLSEVRLQLELAP